MPETRKRKGEEAAAASFVPKRVSLSKAQNDNVIDDDFEKMERTTVDTIRCLSMDGVQKANSG